MIEGGGMENVMTTRRMKWYLPWTALISSHKFNCGAHTSVHFSLHWLRFKSKMKRQSPRAGVQLWARMFIWWEVITGQYHSPVAPDLQVRNQVLIMCLSLSPCNLNSALRSVCEWRDHDCILFPDQFVNNFDGNSLKMEKNGPKGKAKCSFYLKHVLLYDWIWNVSVLDRIIIVFFIRPVIFFNPAAVLFLLLVQICA